MYGRHIFFSVPYTSSSKCEFLQQILDIPTTHFGHPHNKFWTIRRSPYKIDHFRGIPKTFDAFFKVSTSSEQVRQNLVAVWSTSEKFAKLSYIIGYSD